MNSLAYALGSGGGGAGGQGGGFSAFVPLILMFAIFYFLLIRPQQKKAKQHKMLLSSLKKGDKVVSSGGLHGTVTGLTDDTITMEVAPKVRVKVSRGSVAGIMGRPAPPAPQTGTK
jgi:preprotein translocase subunit YajC